MRVAGSCSALVLMLAATVSTGEDFSIPSGASRLVAEMKALEIDAPSHQSAAAAASSTPPAHRLSEAEEAAKRGASKLDQLNEAVGSLDGAVRVHFNRLSPEERASTENALKALKLRTRLLNERQNRLRARIAELRRRIAETERKWASIRKGIDGGRIELAEIRRAARDLEVRAANDRAYLSGLRAAERKAKQRLAETRREANDLRKQYWTDLRDFYERNKLGSPRAYTPRVDYEPATTTRRPWSPYAPPEAVPAVPEVIYPVSPAATKISLVHIRPAVSGTRYEVDPAEVVVELTRIAVMARDEAREAALVEALVVTEEASRRDVEVGATDLEEVSRELAEGHQEHRKAAAEVASVVADLRATAADVFATVDASWQAAKEVVFFDVAGKSLRRALGGTAEALATHLAWFQNMASRLLLQDLPFHAAINASPESRDPALEDRLDRRAVEDIQTWFLGMAASLAGAGYTPAAQRHRGILVPGQWKPRGPWERMVMRTMIRDPEAFVTIQDLKHKRHPTPDWVKKASDVIQGRQLHFQYNAKTGEYGAVKWKEVKPH